MYAKNYLSWIWSSPYELTQQDTLLFAKELFSESFKDINRLLTVFQNGQIEKRNFAKDLSWFQEDHTFEEKMMLL